jgi:tryptophan synthase alpha chain
MKSVLPFVMAGDPALEKLPGLLAEARSLGLDTIEVGLPHSDPIADGPVLQAAAQRAIAAGATPRRVLECLARCADSPDIVLFTYLNPLWQLGADELIRLLRPTPVRSLLVVDLPPGEEAEWEEKLHAAGYPLVPLLAPNTGLPRAAQLLQRRPGTGSSFAQNFVYLVARLGVTGQDGQTELAPVRERIAAMRRVTNRPLAAGFGLGTAGALEAVQAMGARPVIGSALVQRLAAGESLRWALTAAWAGHPRETK